MELLNKMHLIKMKILLLLLFLLPAFANSQTSPPEIFHNFEEAEQPTKLDTLPVYLLVCIDPKTNMGLAPNYTVRGYVVFKTFWIGQHFDQDAIMPGQNVTELQYYLHYTKSRLPKEWIVWDHKPRK